MVDERERDVLRVDSTVGTVVLLEVGSGMDSAGNGTVLEGGLHCILSFNAVVAADVVAGGLYRSAVRLSSLIGRWWWWAAVHAVVDGVGRVLQVVGNVLLARSVDETRLVGILVDLVGVATVARATPLVVDNHLCVNRDGGDGGQVVQDVEPVSDR